MKRSSILVERSFPMMIASYYLARCGENASNQPARPPAALGVVTWKAAYDAFYVAVGDGRSPSQFRNSMKNARDTFDTLFNNGRIGWIDKDGKQPSLSNSFKRIHDEWKDQPDKELETFVLDLQDNFIMAKSEGVASKILSVRPGTL